MPDDSGHSRGGTKRPDDYVMRCPECGNTVMVERQHTKPSVICGCGELRNMDLLKVLGRNEIDDAPQSVYTDNDRSGVADDA
jgi:hypothetical protein